MLASKILNSLFLVTSSLVVRGSLAVEGNTSKNVTSNTPSLKTWWHNTGEINDWTVVKDGNVRQSHMYSVKVASSKDLSNTYYDSFVYETLPRNGHDNILDPRDLQSVTEDEDGISIERDIGMTMAWSSFLYSSDAWVRVSRLDGTKVNMSNVSLRPNEAYYNIGKSDGALYIRIPYSENGFKLSVEFEDDMFDFHNSCEGTHCAIIQNVNPDGVNYQEEYNEDNLIIATEPLNSLLIFASPFLPANLAPDPTAADVHVVKPGPVSDLSSITAKTLYFPPGVFWLGSLAHANLSAHTTWVHLSEGAYVKGAIQFNTEAATMHVTGHGVLSGEQYVYQANPAADYTNRFDNMECLRMWRGRSVYGVNQTFVLQGPTVNAPPFNSMDFTGHVESIAVRARDYKQVGAFYAQTDGLQNYPGSHVRDVFYHSNDDTIKTYFSDVLVERVMVWKAHTAPVIQFGWASRNLSNVTVDGVHVLHSRWNTNGSHPSIIGGNQVYLKPENEYDTAVTSNTIRDVTFSNIHAESVSGNLFRIMPLANLENFVISNVSLAGYPAFSTGIGGSQLVAMTDEDGVPVRVNNFVVEGFSVNGSEITFGKGNWDRGALGDLNIASGLRSGVAIVSGNEAMGEE